VAEEKGIAPALVEKDYWITHCLYGLQQLGLKFELKGGTSLSKGYGIIHRFSEDIDIRIEPPPELHEPRKFFGSKRYLVYGRNILISDPEKTVTDCIDRPDLAGGPAELTRIVHAAMAKIDPDKLVLAAVQMRSTSLLQRLGFLTDLVGRPLREELRQGVRRAIPKSTRSIFGTRPRRGGDIGYVAEWGLFVHARKNDLVAEIPRIRAAAKAPC
jgi:predicted transcriptional regulator of viral defense system